LQPLLASHGCLCPARWAVRQGAGLAKRRLSTCSGPSSLKRLLPRMGWPCPGLRALQQICSSMCLQLPVLHYNSEYKLSQCKASRIVSTDRSSALALIASQLPFQAVFASGQMGALWTEAKRLRPSGSSTMATLESHYSSWCAVYLL